jgi:plastocyanin
MECSRNQRLALFITCATLLVSGCSSSSGHTAASPQAAPSTIGPSLPAGAQVVYVQASDALKFEPASLSLKPGPVRVIFTVTGHLPQTFSSRALGMDSGNVPAGGTVTIQFLVSAPGKYDFYSSYHQKQGMTGTITVKP